MDSGLAETLLYTVGGLILTGITGGGLLKAFQGFVAWIEKKSSASAGKVEAMLEKRIAELTAENEKRDREVAAFRRHVYMLEGMMRQAGMNPPAMDFLMDEIDASAGSSGDVKIADLLEALAKRTQDRG